MIEIPEAIVISNQINQSIRGKRVKSAVANASPHKFAWFFEAPSEYDSRLRERVIGLAKPYGCRVDIEVEDTTLSVGEGVNLRYFEAGEKIPAKHQLLVMFEDGSFLVGSVAMYGGIWAFPNGVMDDEPYRKASLEAISPLSDDFDFDFFSSLFNEKSLKMSAKAFLATEQRIPGLGNGVLQDILLNARIHPKRKASEFTDEQRRVLFDCVKNTLAEMVAGGGRDTEKDIYGDKGGYKTKLSKNNTSLTCPDCGGAVKKEAYMGGSIYYCVQCQKAP